MIYLLSRSSENVCYKNWLQHLRHPFKFVSHFDSTWMPPNDCSIVVTHDTYRSDPCSIILRCVSLEIPVLILADGILEYRNSWFQKHRVDSGVFNPILGHKLACIGDSQVRFLESIEGNEGKCESVGLPRLEFLEESVFNAVPENLLICSSKTPWFTDDDKAKVIQSFYDLKKLEDEIKDLFNINFTWRITPEFADLIEVETSLKNQLHYDLSMSKAVLTMPSTLMLEAMIIGLPVALIDYTTSPHYVPAAWSISSREQIIPVIGDFLSPAVEKLAFQRSILNDSLQIRESACQRLARLVEFMIEEASRCKAAHKPLAFSDKLLS